MAEVTKASTCCGKSAECVCGTSSQEHPQVFFFSRSIHQVYPMSTGPLSQYHGSPEKSLSRGEGKKISALSSLILLMLDSISVEIHFIPHSLTHICIRFHFSLRLQVSLGCVLDLTSTSDGAPFLDQNTHLVYPYNIRSFTIPGHRTSNRPLVN